MPPQVIANAFIAAAGYVLVGLGFGLIYRTARFFHFSHGAVYAIGAYATLSLSTALGWWLAVPTAVLISGGVGFGLFCAFYAPLQRRSVSPTILLVASLGLFVVTQNVISMLYGDEMQALTNLPPKEGFSVMGARVAWFQALAVVWSVVLCAALWAFLQLTRAGLLLRAVANDWLLCRVIGVRSNRIVAGSFFIGSAMAGAAGALLALDTHLFPTMAFRALLMGVTAAVAGGMGDVLGTAIAAVLLALAQHIGAWYLSAQWQDPIGFAVLVVFLLAKPEGLFGKPTNKPSL